MPIDSACPIGKTHGPPCPTVSVHATMTDRRQDLRLSDVLVEHRKLGYHQVAYHYLIRRNGMIVNGRSTDFPSPIDPNAVVIALVGGADESGAPYDNFTDQQKTALIGLADREQKRLGSCAKVVSKTPSISQQLLDSLFNR